LCCSCFFLSGCTTKTHLNIIFSHQMASNQTPKPDDAQHTTPKADISAYLSFGARKSSLRKSIVKQWQQKLSTIADDAARVPGMCTSKIIQSTSPLSPKTSAETSNADTVSTASVSQSFSPTSDEKDDFASWLVAQDFDASAIHDNGENPNLDISHISEDFQIFSPDQHASDTIDFDDVLAAKEFGDEGRLIVDGEQRPYAADTSKEAANDDEVRESKFSGWNLSNLHEIMETIINANCQCWGTSKSFNLGDINVVKSDGNNESEAEEIKQNMTATPKSAYTSRSIETSIISCNSLQLETEEDVKESGTKSSRFETPKNNFSRRNNKSSLASNNGLDARQHGHVNEEGCHLGHNPQTHRVGRCDDASTLTSNSFKEGELDPIPEEKTIENKVKQKYRGFPSTSPCTINYNFSSDEFSSSTPGKRSPLVGEQFLDTSRHLSSDIMQPVLTPLRYFKEEVSSPMTPLGGERICLDDRGIDGAGPPYVNTFLVSPVNLTDRYSSRQGTSMYRKSCLKGSKDSEKLSDKDSVVSSSSSSLSQQKSPIKEKRMQWVKERRRRKHQC